MANGMIRVAIVGAGGRAQQAHYPSLKAMEGVELVAACDLNAERLAQAADRFGVPGRYGNHREMIEKEKPDAVWVVLHPHHLYDVAADVMERGCHLFVEKPPSMTTEQTRQMAILAKRHGVLTGVTFQRRFAPVIRKGKALCEERGPVHTAVATFYKNAVGQPAYYRGAYDILTADAIHAVDTLRYLCGGDVKRVASDVRRIGATYVNAHLALVTFTSGATGVLLTNWMTGKRMFTVEIHSPGISMFGDPEEGGRIFAGNKAEPLHLLDPHEMTGSREHHVAYGALDVNRHLVECMKEGREPETCFDDATKTMELVDRIYAGQV